MRAHQLFKHAAAAIGLSICSLAHAQFKCTAADGKVAFQQAPCQGSQYRQEAVKLRENTIGGDAGLGVEPLEFSAERARNLTIAGAALDVLVTSGEECQIKLKVRPDTPQAAASCSRYLAQHRQWFKPAVNQLNSPNNDDYRRHEQALHRALKNLERVSELHAFITLSLRNR